VRIIRASEIGTYLFCNRAWSYQRKGVESENTRELAAGTELHYTHNREIMAAGCLRTMAMVLLLAALVLVVLHYANQVL
jgi:hypothetical protein